MKTKIIIIVFFLISVNNIFAQNKNVTISGIIKDEISKISLPFVNIVLKTESNNTFVTETITKDDGRFSIPNIKSGNYTIEVSMMGYNTKTQSIFIGNLSDFIDVATIEISKSTNTLEEVTVTSKQNSISNKMDKKYFRLLIMSHNRAVQFYKQCKIYPELQFKMAKYNCVATTK